MRTSLTHPLYVTWIPLDGDEGKLGMTLCPGKYQPVASTGAWDRQLDVDLTALVTMGTHRLVSLVTEDDMRVLRVETLGVDAQEMGIDWDHLPIADTTVPTPGWLDAAIPVLEGLVETVPEGEVAVVHCMGGLSRAGTFMALYLWMRGMSMRVAIDHIRQHRSPNCINFNQQMFLLRFAAMSE
jgi:ADP-ribosyl-[dinitrogen reductase] hydrolase